MAIDDGASLKESCDESLAIERALFNCASFLTVSLNGAMEDEDEQDSSPSKATKDDLTGDRNSGSLAMSFLCSSAEIWKFFMSERADELLVDFLLLVFAN